jgi:hypothetical protein
MQGQTSGSWGRGPRLNAQGLHDASRKRRGLVYCNFTVRHVEGIHLKSRNIRDGTLYAQGRD